VMLDVWASEGSTISLRRRSQRSSLATSGRVARHGSRSGIRRRLPPAPGIPNAGDARTIFTTASDEIKAPTLVIHGTADAAIDIEKAQRLCSELANCEQVIAIEAGGTLPTSLTRSS